jgi:hypothetical protein
MKALISYLDFINLRRSLFGQDPLDLYNDYAEVRRTVENLGSPELLSGNGEYPLEESRRRTDNWLDAMAELDNIEKELMA